MAKNCVSDVQFQESPSERICVLHVSVCQKHISYIATCADVERVDAEARDVQCDRTLMFWTPAGKKSLADGGVPTFWQPQMGKSQGS